MIREFGSISNRNKSTVGRGIGITIGNYLSHLGIRIRSKNLGQFLIVRFIPTVIVILSHVNT